jgi:cell division protein FtsB
MWRAVDHPLYPDDVEHGPAAEDEPGPGAAGEPDEFAPYDRYGRFDDVYRSDDLDPDDLDPYDDGIDRYELTGLARDASDAAVLPDPLGGHDGGRATPGRRPAVLYRFDDLTGDDGRDPTEPLGGGRPGRTTRGRARDRDAGSALRDILVDRDDYRVEPRPRRGAGGRGRWRVALAERLVAAWPGQSEEGAPPGFPASGEVVLPRRPARVPAARGTLVRLPVGGPATGDGDRHGEPGSERDLDPVLGLDDPVPDPEDGPADRADGSDAAVTTGRFGRRRRAADRSDGTGRRERGTAAAEGSGQGSPRPPRSPRSLQRVAMAVYAALADPIANADPETRERRTLQVRRFGVLAGSAALAVVLIYAIFPVRTYLEQRAASQRSSERREKLREANAEFEQREDELEDPETIIEIARRDYKLVFPGEESYGLLPPPVAPTTTTTPPDG